jgi:hypothetical protein
MSTTVVLPLVQQPTATPAQPQQWRPGPFDLPGELDRSTLDVAFKTVFDQTYTLQQNVAQAVVPGTRVASGALKLPAAGVLKAVATGLSTLSNIVVSIDSALQPTNVWATAQPSPTVPGAFDIAVYAPTSSSNNTPVLATGRPIVRWHAYGT